jgi:hypothetical protein
MWISRYRIKLKSLCQDASYRRLVLALGLSLLLHLFIIGKFSFNLPNLNDERDLIQARLVLPKALALPVQKSSVEKKPVTRQSELKKPVELKEAKPLEPSSSSNLEPVQSLELPQVDEVTPIDPSEIVEPVTENQAEDTSSIMKPKPYAYIESDFDVYTESDSVLNRSPAGNAKIVYQRLPNGEQYQIRSLIQAKGLAYLVIPDLLQTSDGYLDGIGLQPMHYLYKFGDKKDKTFSADFDWESRKLNLHSEKGNQSFDLKDGTQDLLSFMYQFMFVPPLQNMQLNITNGKKLGVYDYTFEGEETISTNMGDLKTFHLRRMAEEGEKKTELWLALDYQHVPVKIRETDKEGKIYELLVTNLKTERLATSQE